MMAFSIGPKSKLLVMAHHLSPVTVPRGCDAAVLRSGQWAAMKAIARLPRGPRKTLDRCLAITGDRVSTVPNC